MIKDDVINYAHSQLPPTIHMSLNLTKDSYTQEEADEILSQALEIWEYIKTLRK